MPCWPSKSTGTSSTASPYVSNPSESKTPEPTSASISTDLTMHSSRKRSFRKPLNGNSDSTGDYDTPPWRIDQPNGRSTQQFTVGSPNGRNGVSGNTAFYEPDVTSWKIGPPLLSSNRQTSTNEATSPSNNGNRFPNSERYSEANGKISLTKDFADGLQLQQRPYLDNFVHQRSLSTGSSNVYPYKSTNGNRDPAASPNGYPNTGVESTATDRYKNGHLSPRVDNFDHQLKANTLSPSSQPSNGSVYLYSVINDNVGQTSDPDGFRKRNDTSSTISSFSSGQDSQSSETFLRQLCSPTQTTRSDGGPVYTYTAPNGTTWISDTPLSPALASPKQPPLVNHNEVRVMSPAPSRGNRSGSPIPGQGSPKVNGTGSPRRTMSVSSPKVTSKPTVSEWAWRPAKPEQHERFRTLPATPRLNQEAPDDMFLREAEANTYMTVPSRPIPVREPSGTMTVTHRPSWNANPSQSSESSRKENVEMAEDEYRFGREITLNRSRFASGNGVTNDYFNKIFEDAGMVGFPEVDVFGMTFPGSQPWPSGRHDPFNMSSSGMDDSPFSPSQPSAFQPTRPTPNYNPTTPNSYQPDMPNPYQPTVPNSYQPDTPNPSQPATAPIKGRTSKVDSQASGPKAVALAEKCLQNGQLYRDTAFPAENRSLYFSRPPQVRGNIEWKRPFEICSDPKFVIDSRDRFDVVQGQIGNCWLVSAVAGLTLNKKLLEKVCPGNQSFVQKYAGLFRFHFWRFGKWVEVVVDDRLPTVQGRLMYTHSAKPNEFWSALVEKAYAKVMGSYEALVGGVTSEGFTDLTGGIVESFNLKDRNLQWSVLMKAFQRGSFMGCGIDPTPGITEQQLSNGLVCGHAYTITGVKQFQIPGLRQPLRLIRVRNPWGSEHEWKGAWSDRSPEWQRLPQSIRAEVGLIARADGEFWMSFNDFLSNFHTVDLCHLPPDASESGAQWQVIQKEGTWVAGVTSGGCGNYPDTFYTNPQYRVTLTEPDEGDEDGLCTMIVSMTQKNIRKRSSDGATNLTIGYSILKAPPGVSGPLDKSTISRCETVGSIPSFINSRDISHRHELAPGDYVVVPSTFKPSVEGEFLIRIYTEKTASSRELDEDINIAEKITPYEAPPTPVEKKRRDEILESFDLLAGEDGEIDAWELKKVISLMFTKDFPSFEGFDIEASRSMIAMHDGDMSGKLGRDEFVFLYNYLNKLKKAFKEYDVDQSGSMDIQELRSVFGDLGFKLSSRLLVAICRRYRNKAGVIDVGDFVLCACRLKTIFQTFQANSTRGGSSATFPTEEFITSMVYS